MSENENNIEKLVKKWAEDNYSELNEGGKSDGKPLPTKYFCSM